MATVLCRPLIHIHEDPERFSTFHPAGTGDCAGRGFYEWIETNRAAQWAILGRRRIKADCRLRPSAGKAYIEDYQIEAPFFKMKIPFISFVLVWILGVTAIYAEPMEPGAPTITLWYESGEAVQFYNEVKVLRSVHSSYFSVCGWQSGYFGLQELANGEKTLIFSVWDSDNDDTTSVPESDRVKILDVGPSVRTGRFGNEGSGAQSFLKYNWKNGVSYSFLVVAEKKNKRVEYSAFFRAPKLEEWVFMATFSTRYSPRLLTGLYSFVEDFERTSASEGKKREAIFSNGWVRLVDGSVKPLDRAKFDPDRKTKSVDVVEYPSGYDLSIGGDTQLSQPLDAGLHWMQKLSGPPPWFPGK